MSVTIAEHAPAVRPKPAVEFPDIWTVGEIKSIWGVDPRKAPLTYTFSFYDPDLNRLRSYFQRLLSDGFAFENIEPTGPGFGRIYGSDCWVMKVSVTGVLPSSKLKEVSKRFCDDARSGQVWALFSTIGCSHPSKNSRSADWENRWITLVARGERALETKKATQRRLALPRLDNAVQEAKALKGSPFSAWLPFVKMKLRGTGLVLTDMRPGPSEDEFRIELPLGEYDLALRTHVRAKRIAGLRALKRAGLGTRGQKLGIIRADMATVGVYDRKTMARLLRKGREAFAEWGENARGDVRHLYDVLAYDLKAGAILSCVQTGFGDGAFPVFELVHGGKRVGFEVEFIPEGNN